MSQVNRMSASRLFTAMTLLVLIAFPTQLWAPYAGIDALIAVTQMKASNANDDALHAAKEQQALVKSANTEEEKKQRLETQKQFERDAQRFAEISADLKKIAAELKKHPCNAK